MLTPGIYRHTKQGTLHLVIGVFTHTETREEYVAYVGLTGFWVTPLENFTSRVKVGDQLIPRFLFQKKVTKGKVGQVIADDGRL